MRGLRPRVPFKGFGVSLRVWGALYKAWNWVSFVFVGFCFGFTVEFLLVVLLKVWWGDVGA